MEDNIRSKKPDKDVKDMMIVVLKNKPKLIKKLWEQKELGANLYALPDGDVAGSILTSIVDSDVDMLYGMGGSRGYLLLQ